MKKADMQWYYDCFKCPDPLFMSEWAELRRVVSIGVSNSSGKWSNERFPYQRGIMDALNDPYIEEVVFKSSTQVGKTTVGENFLGWIIDQAPGPIIAAFDNQDKADEFSSIRFQSMVRDTPCLRPKFKMEHKRTIKDGDVNKVKAKTFPGGRIKFVGANSPSDLSSMPARYVYADEVGRWEPAAGDEGDQVMLLRRRTDTFWNRKLFFNSTPGVKGQCRITKLYEESDQQKFFLPCPHCEKYHVLEWKNLRWEKRGEEPNLEHLPNTAHFLCPSCEQRIEQADLPFMLQRGKWQATAKPLSVKTRGFWLWAAYARNWVAIVEDFLTAKRNGREALKAFTNTVLGEEYEEKGQAPEWTMLKSHCGQYTQWSVPHNVLFLTAGTDVQFDRLETSIWGWGKGEESWLIGHEILYGNPDLLDVWLRLDALLTAGYEQPTKQTVMKVLVSCIDSGAKTNTVYNYVRIRPGQFATKGMNKINAPTVGTPSVQDVDHEGRRIEKGVQLWPLGVHTIKTTLYGRMALTEPGPGYVHFFSQPSDEYFLQLTAEELLTKHHRGFPQLEWHQKRERNESLDCYVLAYAAAWLAGIQRLGTRDEEEQASKVATTAAPQPGYSPISRQIQQPQPQNHMRSLLLNRKDYW